MSTIIKTKALPIVTNWHISALFGLGGRSEGFTGEFLEQFEMVLLHAVLLRCMDALTEAQKDELEKGLSENGSDFLWKYFKTTIANFDVITEEELEKIMEYLAVMRSM